MEDWGGEISEQNVPVLILIEGLTMYLNAPLRGRCPEGAEGENLAIARNISGSRTVLSPTACGRSLFAEGAKGWERTFFDSLRHCSGLLISTILHPRSTASQVAKWKGLLITCKNSSCSISVNSCCCNFIFGFLLCSLRDFLTAKATALAAIAYRNFPNYCMSL